MWDSFVDSSSNGLLFHKWGFLHIAEKHSSLELKTYGIFHGQNLIALFPFFLMRRMGFTFLFSPPPKSSIPYLGLVSNNKYSTLRQYKKETFNEDIFKGVKKIINIYKPNYTFLMNVPDFLDIREFKWNGFNTIPNYTYYIDLSYSLDEIKTLFKPEARREINESLKNNSYIENSNDVSYLYNQEEKRFNEQGYSASLYSKSYLSDLKKRYPENLIVYHMSDQEKNILSSVLVQKYKRYILWIGFTRPPKFSNDLFLLRLIEDAKKKNFQHLEILGGNTKHLCAFKSQFNPILKMNFIIEKKDSFGKLFEYLYMNLIRRKF